MTNKDFTPHAFITVSNTGGIEVMLNRSCDGVFYRFNYGQDLEKEEIFESEIVYLYNEDHEGDNEEGNPGFYHGESEDIFYSLNEAMRC